MDNRKRLYEAVMLSGGSTMFPGLPTRLECDVRRLYLDRVLKVAPAAPPLPARGCGTLGAGRQRRRPPRRRARGAGEVRRRRTCMRVQRLAAACGAAAHGRPAVAPAARSGRPASCVMRQSTPGTRRAAAEAVARLREERRRTPRARAGPPRPAHAPPRAQGDARGLARLRLRVLDPPRRKHLVFLGGAVLADIMRERPEFWVSAPEWAEDPRRALLKCGRA